MATVSSSSTSSSLALSGLASGFDWKTLVSQLADVERAPERLLATQQGTLASQNTALTSIKTELTILQSRVDALKDPSFFDSRTAATSDSTVATATAAAATNIGTYSFAISQLASTAVLQGSAGAGAKLSASGDISTLTLSSAPFATPVTSGNITVNGQQVAIETGDTLLNVFDKIAVATGGAVTGSYDPDTDTISLNSASEIVLGSATDTSNFLQVTKLTNNGTGSITSAGKLGAVKMIGTIADSNLATAISDGGSGDGAFMINGVTIHFSATGDSFTNVIQRINNSGAGVIAAYDAINNRFTLTNKDTGDVGIAVQDVTGTFMAATGLASATLARGKNLLYTVNNGPQLTSQTNTITAASSGIAGLSVNVLAQENFSVTVGSDTAKIKSAISDFVTQYNKVQSVINTQTASSTSASGKVNAGALAGDQDTETLNATLRNLMNATVSGLSSSLHGLQDLGFVSNGTNDSLATTDQTNLDAALANNLSGLKDLFTNSSYGLANQLDTFLTNTIGDSGSLVNHQNNLTTQSKNIDTQISNIERQVQAYQDRLTASFVAMETAQSKMNQQLQYLQRTFGGSASSSSKSS